MGVGIPKMGGSFKHPVASNWEDGALLIYPNPAVFNMFRVKRSGSRAGRFAASCSCIAANGVLIFFRLAIAHIILRNKE